MEYQPVHFFPNPLKHHLHTYLLFIPAIAFCLFLVLFFALSQKFRLPFSLKGEAVLGEQTSTSATTEP